MDTFIPLIVLAVVIGGLVLAGLIFYGLTKLDRATRNHQIEKRLREDVADVDARERAARKLLRERSL